MNKEECNKILRESFKEGAAEIAEPPPLAAQAETSSFPAPYLFTPPPTVSPRIEVTPIASVFPKIEFEVQIQKSSFALPPIEHLNLFEHLPIDLIMPVLTLKLEETLNPSLLSRIPRSLGAPFSPERASSPQIAFSSSLITTSLREPSEPRKTLKVSSQAPLPEFPTLEDLGASSYSDFFDAEIVFAPLDNEKGYVFALTLVPNPDLVLPKIHQHYSFLIDRSNSIQAERLSAVKIAISRALDELNLEDSFNIIAFDSKIDKLAPSPLLATSSSIASAKKFLSQIQLGSFFSTTNLYRPLLLTIPNSSQDNGLHTTILFSDGEPLGKKAAQRELALDWTRYNNGRVALYAIGMAEDPHLAALDSVAAFNKGKGLHSPAKRGIRRKLLKLINNIGHPVATSLSIRTIRPSADTSISLYPKPNQMPSLYNHEPYVILGTINKLDDFILFVQGKLKDKWLNIKKNISFVNAKRGGAWLKAQWAISQANELYEKYFSDFDTKHLAEAKNLLEPHELSVAFQ